MHLSLYILDLIERLIKAGAGVLSLTVREDPQNDIMEVILEDNGPGLGLTYQLPIENIKTAKSELGGSAIFVPIHLSQIDGDVHGDLADMLSSVVCTNPDLDLRLKFSIGEYEWSIKISDVAREIPYFETFGLSVARQVHEKIKIQLEDLNSKYKASHKYKIK